MARLADVMSPGYLEGLETWPLKDLRAKRDEATEVETGLSYIRRLVQGRLDIVLAERRRREDAGGSGTGEPDSGGSGTGESGAGLPGLVDQLPTILADHVHAPGLGRLPALMAPGEVDPDLEARMEEVIPAARLAAVTELPAGDLAEVSDGLVDLERTVSGLRRQVFDVIDRVQDELVRRYRTGEATVDSLLS